MRTQQRRPDPSFPPAITLVLSSPATSGANQLTVNFFDEFSNQFQPILVGIPPVVCGGQSPSAVALAGMSVVLDYPGAVSVGDVFQWPVWNNAVRFVDGSWVAPTLQPVPV